MTYAGAAYASAPYAAQVLAEPPVLDDDRTAVLAGSLPGLTGTFAGTVPVDMLGADGVHPNLAGHNHLADAYVAALAAAGRTPSTSTPVYAYGDSWTASTSGYVTEAQKAINQLVTRLNLGTLSNRAVSGHKLGDVTARAIAGSPFVAGTTGLAVVAHAGLNDLKDADTPQRRNAMTHYLRALFAVLSAAQRIENTALTFSGGWATNNWATSSGGSNASTKTEGATVTYNVTTPGTYYLLSHSTITITGGKFTASQGGTTLGTLDLHQQGVASTTVGTVAPIALRLANVAAGTLTITFSTNGRSGAEGWIDALVRISDTPPTILAAMPVPVTAAEFDRPDLLLHIRDRYTAMAAEFGPHVVVADPAPGWSVPLPTPDVITGTLGGTLSALIGEASGTVTAPPVTGTLAGTLSALTGSFAGGTSAATIPGVLQGTLPALVGTFAGTLPTPSAIEGTLVGTLPNLAGSFTGNQPNVEQATTVTVNRANGRTRGMTWHVEIDPPVTTPARDRGHDYAIAASIFGNTLEDGRPT